MKLQFADSQVSLIFQKKNPLMSTKALISCVITVQFSCAFVFTYAEKGFLMMRLFFQWSVMQCGHCFCIECIRIVVDRYSFGGRRRTVKCAVCRQTSLHGEISYVTTSQGHSIDSELALRVKVIKYYKLVQI